MKFEENTEALARGGKALKHTQVQEHGCWANGKRHALEAAVKASQRTQREATFRSEPRGFIKTLLSRRYQP